MLAILPCSLQQVSLSVPGGSIAVPISMISSGIQNQQGLIVTSGGQTLTNTQVCMVHGNAINVPILRRSALPKDTSENSSGITPEA